MAGRALSSKLPSLLSSSLIAAASRPLLPSSLHHLRPLFALADTHRPLISPAAAPRCFSTRATTSSLNDPSPNWSNRPPKETILLEGCDFEHWLCVLEPLDPNLTRDEIIDIYIKTLAEVVGSEDEARLKIYSVSTKHYFAFGALVSEEVSLKIKTLPKVRWVLPDSYLDVKNKDYGGEPFINGQAVPYDPKYHEEWVRNNSRANERNRRNDRPRNNDRSRNFERRRDAQNFQNRGAPPMSNQDFQNPTPPPPRDMPPSMYSNNTSPNPMPPRETPPMPIRDFNASPNPMPPREMPPMPNCDFNASDPPRAYPNQVPNPQGSYAPAGPAYQGNNPGYQGGNPGGLAGHQGNGPNPQGSYAPAGPVYHGNNYQGGNPGASAAHQGNGQGYQGGPPGYPGGSPNYGQGGGPNYQRGGIPSYQQQGGGPSYQQSSPNYQPAGPGYTPGGQGGDPNYRPPPGPSYQQGSQGSSPAYEARDVPGRD